MIVLDTNVVSEIIQQHPDPGVLAWVDSLPATDVATTAVTAGELLYGVARLPAGRRKTLLAAAVRGVLDDDLRGRVEPFDTAAATHYALIVAHRDEVGRPIGMADGQIAAICRRLHAVLATRNVKDFEHTDLEVLDPWHAS